MKVIYTEAAQHELALFQEQQRATLERLIAERKVVFGDETLEVTASDIKEAARRIRPVVVSRNRWARVLLISRLYVLVGIGLMVGAVVYPTIEGLLASNKQQVAIFFLGAFIGAMGWAIGYLYSERRKRMSQIERVISVQDIELANKYLDSFKGDSIGRVSGGSEK